LLHGVRQRQANDSKWRARQLCVVQGRTERAACTFLESPKLAKGATVIYLAKCGEFYKIGFTKVDAKSRVAGMLTGNPYDIELVDTWPGSWQDEQALHEKFHFRKHRGEWFKLTEDDLAVLRREKLIASDDEPRRAAPPNPLALPDLKFPPGLRVSVPWPVGCNWCARLLDFVGEINYLVCDPCERKVPMGTIICNRERRKLVERVMREHALP
jgi:hypothetical protein